MNGIGGYSSVRPGITDARYTARQTALIPFPWRYDAKLCYGVNIALGTSGSSPLATIHALSLNSVYDPDASGTGQQPYFYDQLTAIYSNYLVRKVTFEITFTHPSAAGLWVGWSIGRNGSDSPINLTLGDIMSRPTFRSVPMSNTGEQYVTIKETIPIHEVFGISETQYTSMFLDYGAAYNSNPSLMAYLNMFIVDPNSLITPQYVRAVGRIIYDVQFFNQQAPGGS